jgi:hypothetical protein
MECFVLSPARHAWQHLFQLTDSSIRHPGMRSAHLPLTALSDDFPNSCSLAVALKSQAQGSEGTTSVEASEEQSAAAEPALMKLMDSPEALGHEKSTAAAVASRLFGSQFLQLMLQQLNIV